MTLNISSLISSLKYHILKHFQRSIHVEACLKDLKHSSIWHTKDIKMNSYLLKVPLDILVS